MNTRVFDEVTDETTRTALYELWASTRDAVRELNEMDATIAGNLENRLRAIEIRLGEIESKLSRRS